VTFTILVSAASAYAKPSVALLDPSGRSGDVVRFSITGAQPGVSYDLSVDHDWVQGGTGLLGTFTVPDLG